MKALILGDEINQFHWSMLKSVLLVLSMLPISQGIVHLWQSTEGSSQIMVAGGFLCYQFDEQFIGPVFLVSIKCECNPHSSRTRFSI